MRNPSARGILYLCLGVFVFSTQDAIIKQVSGSYPLTEVVFIRSCVGLPILWVLMQKETGWLHMLWSHKLPLAMRGLIMLGSYGAYYMAFPALPLADAVALYFTVPLFVTALAGPVLGEQVNWKVWGAVVLGFAGVLVMLQPGSGLFEPAALLSLLAAALYGIAMLMARKFGNQLPTAVMAFYQNGFFLVGPALIALALHGAGIAHASHPSLMFLVRPWTMPVLNDTLLIGVCGVVAAAGTMFLTAAYRAAKSSIVTPFEYTGILWAPLWGFVFFSEVPKFTTFIGALIIGVAGLIAMRLSNK
jgi:drug/metabolite transporter (DMT)-like permease